LDEKQRVDSRVEQDKQQLIGYLWQCSLLPATRRPHTIRRTHSWLDNLLLILRCEGRKQLLELFVRESGKTREQSRTFG
jgi:hypothetical protein